MITNKIRRRPASSKRGGLTFKEIPITERILPMEKFFKQYQGKPIEAESGNEKENPDR